MQYKFTEELDKAIIDYCYKDGVGLKKSFVNMWLSTNTYYSMKRRGIFGRLTAYKLKKFIPDFDFDSLKC